MPASNCPITDQDLDRLVDGELSPAEQRELLAALETSPNQWRRCALAYVEAQSLRREFGGVIEPLTVVPPAAPSTPSAPARSAKGPLALAAVLLMATGVGFATRGVWSPGAPADAPLANAPPIQPPAAALEAPPAKSLAAAPAQRPDSPDPDVVTFWTNDEQGNRRSLPTRLIEADELNQRLGVEFRSAVSPEVRRQIEQRGYRLQSRQRYAPLNIDDGRLLVLPVEDMQLAPAPLKYL